MGYQKLTYDLFLEKLHSNAYPAAGGARKAIAKADFTKVEKTKAAEEIDKHFDAYTGAPNTPPEPKKKETEKAETASETKTESRKQSKLASVFNIPAEARAKLEFLKECLSVEVSLAASLRDLKVAAGNSTIDFSEVEGRLHSIIFLSELYDEEVKKLLAAPELRKEEPPAVQEAAPTPPGPTPGVPQAFQKSELNGQQTPPLTRPRFGARST